MRKQKQLFFWLALLISVVGQSSGRYRNYTVLADAWYLILKQVAFSPILSGNKLFDF
jgi:hypothetical protein